MTNAEQTADGLTSQLYRIQTGCHQGLLSAAEVRGFFLVITAIREHIETRRLYYEKQIPTLNNWAKDLRIVHAEARAETLQSSYHLKDTSKDTGYVGPKTVVVFTDELGFCIYRDDPQTSWTESIEWNLGECEIHLEDRSQIEFGRVLEIVRDYVSWPSLRVALDRDNAMTLSFKIPLDRLSKFAIAR